MNSLRLKLYKYMTNEQKTWLFLIVLNINAYKLQSSYKSNFTLNGGDNNLNEYEKTYNNSTGKFNIEIDGDKYYYRVDRYSPDNDKQFKIIDLITIKDKYRENIHCGGIQIDRETKIANILNLGNSNKCLLSTNNTKFKYGYILFQIMIHICKKEKVKKIQLTDNSTITCGKYDLILNILKIITHGHPHYTKYGFRFKDKINNEIMENNYEIFLSNPTINKNELINLIKENANDNIINKLLKVLNKFEGNEVSIKKFVKLLMIDLDNNDYCELIHKIYQKLYLLANYTPLISSKYELDIN